MAFIWNLHRSDDFLITVLLIVNNIGGKSVSIKVFYGICNGERTERNSVELHSTQN